MFDVLGESVYDLYYVTEFRAYCYEYIMPDYFRSFFVVDSLNQVSMARLFISLSVFVTFQNAT